MNSIAQHERLFELLEAVCEERASTDDFAELERLVRGSDDARWTYLTYLDLHGTLLWDAAGGLGVMPEVASAASASRRRSRTRWLGVATTCAAMCLAAVLGVWLVMHQQPRQVVQHVPAPPDHNLPRNGDKSRPERGPIKLPEQSQPETQIAANAAPSSANAVSTPAEIVAPDVPASPIADSSHQRVISQIDELLRANWQRLEVALAPSADDSEWCRRVYLDISGRIPTLAETEAFLADNRRDKRARLVDTLLDDGDYARNFTTIWSRLLVGRTPNPRVNREALAKYLRMSFAANRPWNAMVADLVSAEGRVDENGAANFLVAHLNNQAVPATAITSKLFLCTQIQCAQCHNHPFNDMKQTAFWEFNSLFQQADVLPGGRGMSNGQPRVVATLVSRDSGGPIYYETTSGLMKVAFPRFNGQEVDPSSQTNRRQELARLMTSGDQPQLAAAFVNRLWAHFLGCGFTRPVDDMGPHNPPSHPELLALLSDEFVRSGYDVKQLVRWITSCQAYQLSSRHPAKDDEIAAGDPATFRQVYAKPMSAEQLYDSLLTATQANQAKARDWAAAERQRQKWLEQFVLSLENDENDEAETLTGTHAQALMLMNGELMGQALSLAPGTFLGDLVRDRASEAEKVRKLCLAALSRPPTAKELPAMQKVVRTRTAGHPAAGYQDLFWALLNSNEFALVH